MGLAVSSWGLRLPRKSAFLRCCVHSWVSPSANAGGPIGIDSHLSRPLPVTNGTHIGAPYECDLLVHCTASLGEFAIDLTNRSGRHNGLARPFRSVLYICSSRSPNRITPARKSSNSSLSFLSNVCPIHRFDLPEDRRELDRFATSWNNYCVLRPADFL